MSSFNLYRGYFFQNKAQKLNIEEKAARINEVVQTIFAELNNPPLALDNSPFIVETRQIIDYLKKFNANTFYNASWKSRRIAIIDAFATIHGVKKSFFDKNYNALSDADIVFCFEYLLADVELKNDDEKGFIARIEQELNEIENFLRERQNHYRQVETEPKIIQATIQPQSESQPALTKPETPQAMLINSSTINLAPPVKILAKPPEKNPMQELINKTNAQIELQKYIAAATAERTKQLEIRRKDNLQRNAAWHEEQAKLAQSLKELQRPAQALLEDLRNFSKNLLENYVIQFASTQIELYNLIADNLRWHEPRTENSGSKDYCDAVYNYKAYLDMIVDALADFGVEEISSGAGKSFDGKIHNVTNTKNFSPLRSVIKKSLRSGFRYGDLILQKEDVEV